MNNPAPKIRLCLILHAPMGGGAERFMILLASQLNRNIFDISFILFNSQGEYAKTIPSDIQVIDMGMKLPGPQQLTHPKWILKLSQVLKQINPNVIFSTLGYTNIMTILAKKLARIKGIIIVQETGIISNFLVHDPWFLFKRIIYKTLYARVNVMTAPTKSILADLESLLSVKFLKSEVIPNFINAEFIENAATKNWNPERLNLKNDRPIIISLGRLDPVKGYDVGLTVFNKLNQSIPSYYWILGSGKEEIRLKQLAENLGISQSVYFLGFQENPYIFLKHADVFLMPSQSEGFPIALLEAMYCGLPCVVNHYNDSIHDFVSDQEDGLITHNQDEMVASLKRILTEPILKKNLKHRSHIKAMRFESKIIIKQFEELFIREHTNQLQGNKSYVRNPRRHK